MKELLDVSIESYIVRFLQKTSFSTVDLIEAIQKIRPHTPKQSVYLALRKLKKKEIITLHKKMVSLHKVWIADMKDFFTKADVLSSAEGTGGLLNLQEKEYVSYKFKSLLSLDMYWAHAFAVFIGNLNPGDKVLLYNPHQWFLIARKKSELTIIKEVDKQKISWIQLIGGKKALDIQIKKYFDGASSRCYLLGKNIFDNNYYVNCFGDLLIEVWLDEKAAQEIEVIYSKYKNLDEEVIKALQAIVEDKRYFHKMKISRNIDKSKKLSKVFGKYFIL